MSRQFEFEREIAEAREGLVRLINDMPSKEIIDGTRIDNESMERIRELDFYDDHHCPFFYKKDNNLYAPACFLSGMILSEGISPIAVKYFLFAYCVICSNQLLHDEILTHLDSWLGYRGNSYRELLDLSEMPTESISHLVDGILDIDAILRYAPYQQISIIPRANVALFCLTAGYHYHIGIKSIPQNLQNRMQSMHLLTSKALFLSILNGKAFDEEFSELLRENGLDESLSDIFLMVQNNKQIDELNSRKLELLQQLDYNKELLRRQELSGEIIKQAFGTGASKSTIVERIQKCDNIDYLNILYQIEGYLQKKLSFLSDIRDCQINADCIGMLKKEYEVQFSSRELSEWKSIENIVDSIIRHRRFLKDFKNAIFSRQQLEPILDDDVYDLETRIAEIEASYGTIPNKENIHSIEDILSYISNPDTIFAYVKQLIIDQLGALPEEVSLEANIRYDLGADSLDEVEVIMEVEKTYGIKIPDEVVSHINTVQDIYDAIVRNTTVN